MLEPVYLLSNWILLARFCLLSYQLYFELYLLIACYNATISLSWCQSLATVEIFLLSTIFTCSSHPLLLEKSWWFVAATLSRGLKVSPFPINLILGVISWLLPFFPYSKEFKNPCLNTLSFKHLRTHKISLFWHHPIGLLLAAYFCPSPVTHCSFLRVIYGSTQLSPKSFSYHIGLAFGLPLSHYSVVHLFFFVYSELTLSLSVKLIWFLDFCCWLVCLACVFRWIIWFIHHPLGHSFVFFLIWELHRFKKRRSRKFLRWMLTLQNQWGMDLLLVQAIQVVLGHIL